MFVKVLSRKNPSYKQLAEYILKDKVPNNKAKDVFKHNIKGNSIKEIVKEFERNESFRNFSRKDQVALYHIILSLSSNEEQYIPDELIADLTKKFIELRGYNGVYLGSTHRDQEHVHSHLMVSALEYMSGKAFRISKSELQDIKLILQEYHLEKYPQLTESYCEHGAGKDYVTDKEYQRRHKHERTKLKESVQLQVQELFKQSKSFDEFISTLRENGLHHYERQGIPQGVVVNETKIRFTRLGIAKEEIDELKTPKITQPETTLQYQEPLNVKNMKATNINRPINTENTFYDIHDEFENPIDFEPEKSLEERALDWLEELEEPPISSNDFFNELFSEQRNPEKKEFDLDI